MKTIGIQLTLVQVVQVDLQVGTFNVETTAELKIDKFSVRCLHNNDDLSAFGIEFEIKLSHSEEFYLALVVIAHFTTDQPYDKEFLDSDFTKINAPAIAFPYIRAYISNLTLNSGYNPVILPPYNFVELERQRKLGEATNKKQSEKPKPSKKVKSI